MALSSPPTGSSSFLAHEGAPPPPTLADLFAASLRLGAIGFGGGVSVLAHIQSLMVNAKGWLSEEEFTRTATVAQMLPGGASSNALAYIGLRFYGLPGAVLTYVGFVLPGALSVLALAWAYVRFGTVLHVDSLLSGFNAAVVGIVSALTFRMVRTGVALPWQMGVVAAALLLGTAAGLPSGEIALLGIGAGLVVELRVDGRRREEGAAASPLAEEKSRPRAGGDTTLRSVLPFALAALLLTPSALGSELLSLAGLFFHTGLGAYGGGFAIIPALQSSVSAHGWLTERQFADAVAVGKLTPGPVLLLATFIGYVRAGLSGALVATIAILAAPFGLVILLAGWLDRVRSHRWVRAGMRGLTPAVAGLMASAALTLGASLDDRSGLAIAAAAGLTLTRFEVNPALLLVFGGLTQIALRTLGWFQLPGAHLP